MKNFWVVPVILWGFFNLSALAQTDLPSEDTRIQQSLEQQFDQSREIHGRYDARYYWDVSQRVRVEVKEGVVTLKGLVQDSEAKKTYERIARTTPGVKDVVVQIRVIPSERKVD